MAISPVDHAPVSNATRTPPDSVRRIMAKQHRSRYNGPVKERVEQLNVTSTHLPVQLTSFVGRRREIVEVERLLSSSHLVTLTGASGCGKTRLALQVAGALERDLH